MLAATTFSALDWTVLLAYLALVVVIGVACSRGQAGGTQFFLAGRRMPMWAVAVSLWLLYRIFV